MAPFPVLICTTPAMKAEVQDYLYLLGFSFVNDVAMLDPAQVAILVDGYNVFHGRLQDATGWVHRDPNYQLLNSYDHLISFMCRHSPDSRPLPFQRAWAL